MHAGELLSTRALLTPDRIAVVDASTGLRFTFAELNARAIRLAHVLSGRYGVQEGDRVSILANNCVAYVDLLFGLPRIGAVFAPLNARLTARELLHIINDCTPKVLIYAREFQSVVDQLALLTALPRLVKLGKDESGVECCYEEELTQAPESELPQTGTNDESPFALLYTSGTTGAPKGAVIPQRQVLWNCVNTVISWGLTERDVSPIFTPMYHAGGLFVFLTPLMYAGGRIVLTAGLDPEQSLELIRDEQCTVILGVPTLFRNWLSVAGSDRSYFAHVRWFVSGGAPCPVPLIESWNRSTGTVLRQGYGLTEVGVNCFTMTDEEAWTKRGSVGKPIFHSRARIVDAAGIDVKDGETGELLFSGPHVTSGYWKNDRATADALRDGWFHTGDIARRDADGCYFIVGRAKDMIISGGENVYAAEVEAVFREHPAVADAALLGQPDEKWGEVGLMVTVLRAGMAATEKELCEFCRQRLARYKVPKRVVFDSALPYSPYGKVMKAELRRKYVPSPESR